MKQAEESESDFLVYTGTFCGYCTVAKRLLTSKGLSFDEINFEHENHGLRSKWLNSLDTEQFRLFLIIEKKHWFLLVGLMNYPAILNRKANLLCLNGTLQESNVPYCGQLRKHPIQIY